MGKKLILIHGRHTKPSASAHKRLILTALINGLSRVSTGSVKRLLSGEVECIFSYYGDINNELMAAADPSARAELTARNDAEYNAMPCLSEGPYIRALEQLRIIENHDGMTYGALVDHYRDGRWLDELAIVVSAAASVTALSETIVKWATADMSQYLHTRKVGSEVRERLQKDLKPVLLNGDEICLVSHSMGCIVSYDVLWKFSRMSEYRHVQKAGNRISLWLTLGCPLGEPGVRRNLYDANERGEDRFPRNIIKDWINVAAEDDFVAHDSTMANDFDEMIDMNYLNQIRDYQIYNFWVKDGRLNPHSFYGYLDHPLVAERLANWIESESQTAESGLMGGNPYPHYYPQRIVA